MDSTDDITTMLESDLFEAETTELATPLLERLRRWSTAQDEQQRAAQRGFVLALLLDALLPQGVAGNLDYGDTALNLLYGALYEGLDLAVLHRRLAEMLAQYERAHRLTDDPL